MDIISKFVTNFYEKERHSLNQAAPYIGSNEASLRIWLRENNIDVEKIYDFRYKKNNNGVIVPSGYSGFQLEKI
jgi:predicted HTH domain antitoxin